MADQKFNKMMAAPNPPLTLSKQKNFWVAWLGGQLIAIAIPLFSDIFTVAHLYIYISVALFITFFILNYVAYRSVRMDKFKGKYIMLVVATMACLGLIEGSLQLFLFNDKLDKDSFKWYFLSFIILCVLWGMLLLVIHFPLGI